MAARHEGERYQARWFWCQALRMFLPSTNVVRVTFEHSEDKHFDDVVTEYVAGYYNRGLVIDADCTQMKFHVVSDGALTFDNLMDRSFMGSKSATSLLERLISASNRRKNGRFELVTPWRVDHRDALGQAHRNDSGELRVHHLLGAGPRSRLGKLRNRLIEHAGVSSAEELGSILSRLRLHHGKMLEDVTGNLDVHLDRFGLPIIGDSAASTYDALPFALLTNERVAFDVDELKRVLVREFGWDPRMLAAIPERRRVAIKQFDLFAEYFEDHVGPNMLDLRDIFDERVLEKDVTWDDVYRRVQKFMRAEIEPYPEVELHVAAAISVIFVAGHSIRDKAPCHVIIKQPGRRGAHFWDLAEPSAPPQELWSVTSHEVRGEGDMALAISATHDVLPKVMEYAQKDQRIGSILHLSLPSPGQSAVIDGSHAVALGDLAASAVREHGTPQERPLHVFASGPHALIFTIGRSLRWPNAIVLYEYSFGSSNPQYTQSITIQG